MLPTLKINTAAFICLAFLTRLVLINTSLAASPDNSQPSRQGGSQAVCENERGLRVDKHTEEKNYTSVEICEEDTDAEEDVIKVNPPLLLSFLYSIFKKEDASLASDNPFDSIKCNLYPRKYLALSILRI